MKRSYFIKSLGLGAGGLILPNNSFIQHQPTKIYDNYIKGLSHYNFKKLRPTIKEGDPLLLKREVDNTHDTYAIEIYFEAYKLGYITAYENIVLANMLDNGIELKAYVSLIDSKAAIYKGLAIEIYAELIIPSNKLITLMTNEQRADDATDIYRTGF